MSKVDSKIKKLKSTIKKSYVLETTNSGQEYRLYFTDAQVNKIVKLIAKELLYLNKMRF